MLNSVVVLEVGNASTRQPDGLEYRCGDCGSSADADAD
jgi:hypothetical protein